MLDYFRKKGSKIQLYEQDDLLGEFVPLDGKSIDIMFAALEKRGYLKKGASFLDAGSGDGRIVAEAASRGLVAYGIEFNPELYEDSVRNLKHLEKDAKIPKGSWQIACGNFLENPPYVQMKKPLVDFDIIFNFHNHGDKLFKLIEQERKPQLFIYVSPQKGFEGKKLEATVKLSSDPGFSLTLYVYRIYIP